VTFMDALGSIFVEIISSLEAWLIVGLAAAALWGRKYVAGLIKNQMAKEAMERVIDIVEILVRDAAQRLAEPAKEAAEDGKLTELEKARIKKEVVDMARDLAGGWLTILGYAMGFGSKDDVDKLLDGIVEATVHGMKQGK